MLRRPVETTIAKQTLGAAAGAAAIAVGGPVAALPGAPIFSSEGALGSGMWASPVGTGIISGGINAGSQYLQNGDINLVNVAAARMVGPVGVYGGLGWNVGVNAVSGAASTVINNKLYGKSDSVMFSGIAAGVASSFGYGVGKSIEKAIESYSRSTMERENELATTLRDFGDMWNGQFIFVCWCWILVIYSCGIMPNSFPFR